MQYLDVDKSLADSVLLRFLSSSSARKIQDYRVPFQFPPKVTSDSKSGDWDEQASNSYFSEPIPTFKGSKPRTINIKWSYVVDGGIWTTKNISTIVRALRGYFTRMDVKYLGNGFNYEPMKIELLMYRNVMEGPEGKFLGRIDSFDISHSENLIVPFSLDNRTYRFVVDEEERTPDPNNSIRNAYPLRTDITTTVKLFNTTVFSTPAEQPQPNVPPVNPQTEPQGKSISSINRNWF